MAPPFSGVAVIVEGLDGFSALDREGRAAEVVEPFRATIDIDRGVIAGRKYKRCCLHAASGTRSP